MDNTLHLVFYTDEKGHEHSLFAVTATRKEMLALIERLKVSYYSYGVPGRVINFRPLTHYKSIAGFEEAHQARKRHLMEYELDQVVTATFLR